MTHLFRTQATSNIAAFLLPFIFLVVTLAAIAAAQLLLEAVFFVGVPAGGVGVSALIVATLSAPLVFWRNAIAHRALSFQKEGHITERITKAVEQLGSEKKIDKIGLPIRTGRLGLVEGPRETYIKWLGEADEHTTTSEEIASDDSGEWKVFSETIPNLEVRVGAIFSLERIAQDSTEYDHGRDHVRVMEILAAYVRHNSRLEYAFCKENAASPHQYRIDLQSALDVIGRRNDAQRRVEEVKQYRINLQNSYFFGASFMGGHFEGVLLLRSKFVSASFKNASFAGTSFIDTVLIDCDYTNAELRGTRLDQAILRRSFHDRHDLFKANLNSAMIGGADISGMGSIPADAYDRLLCTTNTLLPRPATGEAVEFLDPTSSNRTNHALSAANLKFLAPVENTDPEYQQWVSSFRKHHGLEGWPYVNSSAS